ncbi:hypothetical protein CMV_018933 [Castanea mollissima]|uniref:Chitinase domain-containing protein 1 n=1 Tax=Castanea mollissima TaxID=60419 RepID=A0A8J4QQZ4_9ROSI|nr:hypothetical protein CMV_018933 [Castanea mollissima]
MRNSAYFKLYAPCVILFFKALQFVKQLGHALHSVSSARNDRQTVAVGPNAPLKWIHSTLQLILRPTGNSTQGPAHKIFLGINFYGNDFVLAGGFGGGAVTGRDYLSLLEKHRPLLRWEKSSGEHLFFYSDDDNIKHAVYYPSLLSISMRLEEARSWGCGISIWEIGQDEVHLFLVKNQSWKRKAW